MEDKKVLKDKELEKVNGGLGNHEFEFGNTLISGTSIPGIDMNEVPDSTPCAVGSELDEYAQKDKHVK